MTGPIALVLVVSAPTAHVLGEDPWPTWQRTASRLGRTPTIGPETPTIAWTIRVDPRPDHPGLYMFSGILDAEGRLFVGHTLGLAAVDTATHEIRWQFTDAYSVMSAPSLYNGRVLFGSTDDFFYCVEARTGKEIWKVPAEPHPDRSCAVDDAGVVYYPSQLYVLYARRVADGSEVWTRTFPDSFRAPPTLDGLGKLYIPNVDLGGDWLALDTVDGETVWAFDLPSDGAGLSCYENGSLYLASRRYLFGVNAEDGTEQWPFWTEVINGGTSAIRHDGVIYILASNFATGWLFAVTPDGEELWRYPFSNQSTGMPGIVDGAGTFYFCSHDNVHTGYVHAVRSDGSALWVKAMPDMVSASPTLGPDGTLYVVCSDKYLYAFHDPPNLDKSDAGDHKQPTDVRPVPQP